MASAESQSRWLFLVSPRWLTWHAFSLACAVGMLLLGDWQFHRAESGNALSWAYTFEWPIFTIFVLIFWAKTIVDEYRHPGGAGRQPETLRVAGQATAAGEDDLALPSAAHTAAETDDEAADDPELAAYNAYLARLNNNTAANNQTAQHTQSTREESGSAP